MRPGNELQQECKAQHITTPTTQTGPQQSSGTRFTSCAASVTATECQGSAQLPHQTTRTAAVCPNLPPPKEGWRTVTSCHTQDVHSCQPTAATASCHLAAGTRDQSDVQLSGQLATAVISQGSGCRRLVAMGKQEGPRKGEGRLEEGEVERLGVEARLLDGLLQTNLGVHTPCLHHNHAQGPGDLKLTSLSPVQQPVIHLDHPDYSSHTHPHSVDPSLTDTLPKEHHPSPFTRKHQPSPHNAPHTKMMTPAVANSRIAQDSIIPGNRCTQADRPKERVTCTGRVKHAQHARHVRSQHATNHETHSCDSTTLRQSLKLPYQPEAGLFQLYKQARLTAVQPYSELYTQAISTADQLYSELMSWRRTNYLAGRGLVYLLVFLVVNVCGPPNLVPGALASESPDRECCENPMYTFDLPPNGGVAFTTFAPPYPITYEPPEQPDLPEVPEVPGLYPTPASGSLGCLEAKQLCIEDQTCAQILQVIPMVCGLEQVVCSTITVSKCQAALRTLRSFPYFNPTCLCKPPTPEEHFCNDFSELLFDHPCLNTLPKVTDPYPVDALPYCTHAQDICNNEPSCKRKVVSFQKKCRVKGNSCQMDDVGKCHSSWQDLRQSPIFGCICPAGMNNLKRCQEVFQIVNNNTCIDAQIPDALKPVISDLGEAEAFWINYYRGVPGYDYLDFPRSSQAPPVRTTRDSGRGGVETSTPWHIPSGSDWISEGPKKPSQKDERVLNMKSTCHIALDNCERDTACRPYLDNLKSRCVDTCSRDRCMGSVQEFYRKIPRKHALDIAFCLCREQNDDQCFRAQSLLHPVCAQTPVNWSNKEEDLPACQDLAKSCNASPDCRMKLSRYEQACAVDANTKTCAGPYEQCRTAMLHILGTELRMTCNCNGSGGISGDFRRLYDCIGYQRLFWLNPCIMDSQKDYHLMIGNTEGPNVEWNTPPGYTTPFLPPQPPYRPPPPPPATKPPPTRYRPPPKPTPPVKTEYCKVEDLDGGDVKFIREGFEKRFYAKNKEGSNLCSCKEYNGESQHYCTYLQEIEKKPCNTGKAFYSHNSPFYLPSRGQCLCYSGQFICAKPDYNKGTKRKAEVPQSPPGVYLYLGFSRIDSEVLKKGRMKLNDEVPLTEEDEELEVKNTIQQTVSHFTSNANKSDCRISLESRQGENYILKATLDEFDEYRMKKNMSEYMKWKEKEECFAALDSISSKVNAKDRDMMSHIILSMFKVAAAEANVPEYTPSCASSYFAQMINIVFIISFQLYMHRQPRL